MNRGRALLITYHWPPSSNAAVLRPLSLARHLADFGWDLVVYTADAPQYQQTDPNLTAPSDRLAELWRGRIWEPYRWYKRVLGHPSHHNAQEALVVGTDPGGWRKRTARWIRANAFIPDARALWIRPSVHRLSQYLTRAPVDVLISTGPPHTNHCIAARVKARWGLPWLADFQDPWTDIGYFPSLPLGRRARLRHERWERHVLETADRVTTVSPDWARLLAEKRKRPVECLPLGYEECEFPPPSPGGPGFTLLHGGTLGRDRFPLPLARGLARFARSHPVRLECYGEVDESLPRELERLGARGLLTLGGALSRRDVLARMQGAGALLLIPGSGSEQRGRIPAKTYEYLRAGRPILCLGDPEGDAARLLRHAGAGLTVAPGSSDAVLSGLEQIHRWWKQGRSGCTDPTPHSARHAVAGLALLLDELAGSPREPHPSSGRGFSPGLLK